MRASETLSIWRRHWILTAFLLLLALCGSATAVMKLPRTYQSDSTVVLVPSRQASKALGGGNPYLSFDDSLATTADIVATEMTSPRVEQALAMRGFDERYTVISESTTGQTVASGSVLPGPFIVVTVTGKNSGLVEQTLSGVTDDIGAEVTAMQASLAPSKRFSLATLSLTPRATMSVSMTARSLILIIGLLIILALAVPVMVDGQTAQRRARRASRSLPAPRATAEQGDSKGTSRGSSSGGRGRRGLEQGFEPSGKSASSPVEDDADASRHRMTPNASGRAGSHGGLDVTRVAGGGARETRALYSYGDVRRTDAPE
jgi:hypothetical protein